MNAPVIPLQAIPAIRDLGDQLIVLGDALRPWLAMANEARSARAFRIYAHRRHRR